MTSTHKPTSQSSHVTPRARAWYEHGRPAGRRSIRVLTTCALVLAVVVPGSATAQDTTAKRVHVTADLGYVNTTGNTSLTSFNLGDKLTVTAGTVLITQTASLIYGRTSGVETANNQTLRLRADQPLTKRLDVYGFGDYQRNKFAGIARRLSENVGLGYRALQAPRDSMSIQAGAGLVQESFYIAPGSSVTQSDNFPIGRAAAVYKHLFSESSYFQQTVEYLPNMTETADYRINSESSIVAPISAHFGLKASALIQYNNQPSTPGFRKTDRFISAGLQFTY